MPRYLILLAALLAPAQAFAADAGGVQASLKVTGHVPVSCRVVPAGTAGEPTWACNNQAPATVTRTDASGTMSSLTIRPLV